MPEFEQLFATLSNPVLGVLVGAVVTAIIQSSSASIGILQALSSTGQITCSAAFPIIMGQNIGTCITPILASIGASKNAKRSAVVHLSFNVIGTIIFLAATYTIQYTVGIPFWNDVITKGGIANFLRKRKIIQSKTTQFQWVLPKTLQRGKSQSSSIPLSLIHI